MQGSQFKIVSDGLSTGTYVTFNGERLEDVVSVSWEIRGVDRVATAVVTIEGVDVEVAGDGELRIRPWAKGA